MRYWVYINDKVEGPYDENKLVTLNGFTPDTLICAENAASGGSQEWDLDCTLSSLDCNPVIWVVNCSNFSSKMAICPSAGAAVAVADIG